MDYGLNIFWQCFGFNLIFCKAVKSYDIKYGTVISCLDSSTMIIFHHIFIHQLTRSVNLNTSHHYRFITLSYS